MDVAGGFSSILYLLKLKDLVRKKKRIKNDRTNVVQRSEKLTEKSPNSKNLENVNLDCKEIENKGVNDCRKIIDNSGNIECKEIEDNSINIDCKEIGNNSVDKKKDEGRIFKKIDLMPSIIPAKPSIISEKPSKIHATEMCELCGVIIRKTSMETHMNVHLNRKPFVCNFKNCGKSFSSAQSLCCHKKFHKLSKEFTCSICTAQFHLKGNLRKHEASHLQPTFKCMICERMFKTPETLKFHMNKHKDSENLSCTHPSCDKKLKNPSSLREHLRKYHNIRVRERVAKQK